MRVMAAALALAGTFMLAAAGPSTADIGVYVSEWNTGLVTYAVTLGPDGFVYVSTSGGLLKYSPDGTLQATIGATVLGRPQGVAFDAQGKIYVADYAISSVQVFSSSGQYLDTWGTGGTLASYLAIDALQHVFVTDVFGSTIRVFTTAGTPVTSWVVPGAPNGIAIDHNQGVLVVALAATNKIRKYGLNGDFMQEFGSLSSPEQLALTPDGVALVAEEGGYRMSAWSSAGSFVGSIGSQGSGPGQFENWPMGVACAVDGTVYIADYAGRVQKFAAGATSTLRSSWGALKRRYR